MNKLFPDFDWKIYSGEWVVLLLLMFAAIYGSITAAMLKWAKQKTLGGKIFLLVSHGIVGSFAGGLALALALQFKLGFLGSFSIVAIAGYLGVDFIELMVKRIKKTLGGDSNDR